MYNFFEVIKTIYLKRKIDFTVDKTLCINLVKWLSFDRRNLNVLSRLVKEEYHTRLEPNHFFYMLYLEIPKGKTPYLQSIKRVGNEEKTGNKVYTEIASQFQWSERECQLQQNILEKVIDKKYWKKELGIK